jgi:hypothetical protein
MKSGPEHARRAQELLAQMDVALDPGEDIEADVIVVQALAAAARVHIAFAALSAQVLDATVTGTRPGERLSWLQAIGEEEDEPDAGVAMPMVRECPECHTRWGVDEHGSPAGCPLCEDRSRAGLV